MALGLTTVGGCVVRARMGATVHAEPDLVEVSPGVWVVEDYDEPVFWSDGWYWRYYGGVWYRSSYHTGGWVTYRAPRAIVSIRAPHTYVRYHATGNVRYRSGPRGAVRVRDHRDNGYHRGPSVRDHRDARRDAREDRRDARQEWREDRRDARKDAREERRDERKDAREEHREDRKDAREERRDERKEWREDRKEERKDRRRR